MVTGASAISLGAGFLPSHPTVSQRQSAVGTWLGSAASEGGGSWLPEASSSRSQRNGFLVVMKSAGSAGTMSTGTSLSKIAAGDPAPMNRDAASSVKPLSEAGSERNIPSRDVA